MKCKILDFRKGNGTAVFAIEKKSCHILWD